MLRKLKEMNLIGESKLNELRTYKGLKAVDVAKAAGNKWIDLELPS